jgi:hypothetical protein
MWGEQQSKLGFLFSTLLVCYVNVLASFDDNGSVVEW